MEIQAPTHQEMNKLLSHTLKTFLVALGRVVSKTSKLILIDLELLFRRGKTLAGKAIRKFISLRHNHHTAATALSCRPSDADNYLSSFISPRDYQFSCSSSPIIRRRSKHRSHNYHYNVHHHKRSSFYYNGVSVIDKVYNTVKTNSQNDVSHPFSSHIFQNFHRAEAVDKVLDLLNKGEARMGNETPEMELPGFGKSPVARQLRVTDSPFSLREGGCGDERSGEVDKAAEEFIDKFYKELKMQRKMAPAPAAISYCVDSIYNRT